MELNAFVGYPSTPVRVASIIIAQYKNSVCVFFFLGVDKMFVVIDS